MDATTIAIEAVHPSKAKTQLFPFSPFANSQQPTRPLPSRGGQPCPSCFAHIHVMNHCHATLTNIKPVASRQALKHPPDGTAGPSSANPPKWCPRSNFQQASHSLPHSFNGGPRSSPRSSCHHFREERPEILENWMLGKNGF